MFLFTKNGQEVNLIYIRGFALGESFINFNLLKL